MSQQWIEQLREKMADYRRPAPELSWEKIDRVLETRQQESAGKGFWLRRMAAAALLLLMAGATYWALRQDEPSLRQNEPSPRPTAKLTVSPQSPKAPSHPVVPTMPSAPVIPAAPVASITPTTPITPTAPTADNPPADNPPADNPPPQAADRRTPPAAPPAQVVYPSDLRQPKQRANRLTAKVYLSNTMNESRHTESFAQQRTEMTIYSLTRGDKTNPNDAAKSVILRDTITTVKTTQADRQIHHRQPVRFGLSLRYQLSSRWSVESGLSYTRLSSDITTQTWGTTTVTEQRLNYIGLPLGVSYQLWASRYFGLYATAGGTIEKMLDGSPWQFSLNCAAGVEYRLTDHFSLYAEPGIGYYFPDGSTTPTIYQDHPLNLNLSFGLRISKDNLIDFIINNSK